jgi:hypothetical protein
MRCSEGHDRERTNLQILSVCARKPRKRGAGLQASRQEAQNESKERAMAMVAIGDKPPPATAAELIADAARDPAAMPAAVNPATGSITAAPARPATPAAAPRRSPNTMAFAGEEVKMFCAAARRAFQMNPLGHFRIGTSTLCTA